MVKDPRRSSSGPSPAARAVQRQSADNPGMPAGDVEAQIIARLTARLTPDQLEALASLADEAGAAAGRMAMMIDTTIALIDRPIDEVAMRSRAAARLAANPVVLDPNILSKLAPP